MLDDDLALALELADVADSLSMPRFRALDLAVETKADRTPVTEVDRAVERALRGRLDAERPDDAVLGEEEGATGEGGRRWLIDPIDGTKNYSRAIPVWATLIALEEDGEVALGVASAPALGRRWWAARGRGAYADGAPIRVSTVGSIEECVLAFTRRLLVEGGPGALAFVARAWHARSFADFWQHVLVAEGSVDLAVEPLANAWDLAAVQVIVEEAGGRFTDLAGERRCDGGNGLSSNGVLHDEALAALAR